MNTKIRLFITIASFLIFSVAADDIELKLRDYGLDSDWHGVGIAVDFGDGAEFSHQFQDLGLSAHGLARNDAKSGLLRIDFSVNDNSEGGAHRLLQARVVIKKDLTGWNWHDDIYKSRVIDIADGVYANSVFCGVGENSSTSRYPIVAVSKRDGTTLVLGMPPDTPRICRLEYDNATNSFYAQFDFALAPDATSAQSGFSVLFFECGGGFRGALDSYYKAYPEFFSLKVIPAMSEGIWMPFGTLADTKDPEDFFFMFHEIGVTNIGAVTAADDDFGQLSFIYEEPWSFWMPVPRGEDKSYDNLIGLLQDYRQDHSQYPGNPLFPISKFAEATISCGIHDEDGRYHATPRIEPWCDGALFRLNASPHIDGKGGVNRYELVVDTYLAAKDPVSGELKQVPGWEHFGEGYGVAMEDGVGGTPCMKLESYQPGAVRGARTVISLDQEEAAPISVRGLWRSVGLSGPASSNCSLYADLTHQDGSHTWGLNTPFTPGDNEWSGIELEINPGKPIKSLSLYVLLRGQHTGTLWIDSLSWRINGGAENPISAAPAPVSPGKLDGVFLDSVEAWGLTQNYNQAHFAEARHPLSFNPRNKKPLILNAFSGIELIDSLGALLRQDGRMLMGNTVLERYWFTAPRIEIIGTETNWQNNITGSFSPGDPGRLAFIRSVAGHKPYFFLFNTNYDLMTYDKYKTFFGVCAFFGFYPSMFSVDAATNPFWFNPNWYETTRPLFLKYIPLIMRMREAGWRPVSKVETTGSSKVLLERYGEGDDIYLAFYNPTRTQAKVKYSLPGEIAPVADALVYDHFTGAYGLFAADRREVGLEPYGVKFVNIFTRSAIPGKRRQAMAVLRRLLAGRERKEELDRLVATGSTPWQIWEALAGSGDTRPSVLAACKDMLFWSHMAPERLVLDPEPAIPGAPVNIQLTLAHEKGQEFFIAAAWEREFTRVESVKDANNRSYIVIDLPDGTKLEEGKMFYIKRMDGDDNFTMSKFRVVTLPPVELRAALSRPGNSQPASLDIEVFNNTASPLEARFTVKAAEPLNLAIRGGELLIAAQQSSLTSIPLNPASIPHANYPIAISVEATDIEINLNTFFNHVPEVWVPRFDSAPAIDGILNDWQGAVELGAFSLHDKVVPAIKQTKVKLGFDKDNFYVMFVCEEPFPEKLRAEVADHDGNVWEDDCVEIFLKPENLPIIHLLLNSANVGRDEKIVGEDTDVGWNGKWNSATAIVDGAWIAEFAIPWKTLGLDSPPQSVKANFNRQETSGGECSGWSCTYGAFLNPERFGLINFIKQRTANKTEVVE